MILKIRFTIIAVFCCQAFAQFAVAQQSDNLTKAGTAAGQFLKIPVGARAIGMGGAYVALANDVSSVHWNPAGLVSAGRRGAANFVHTDWLAGMTFDFAGVVVKFDNANALGLSITVLSMSDMAVRTEFEPEGTGEFFSASDLALGLSYARQLTDRFSLGGNARYVRQQIWHSSASTVAFDVGIQFQTEMEWLRLGLSVSNFGPKLKYSGKDLLVNFDFDPNQAGDSETIFADLQTDSWDLPLLFRFGMALQMLRGHSNQLTLALEGHHPNDNTEHVNFGMEYGFRRWFYLRGGYQALFSRDSERGLALGVGLVHYLGATSPMKFDYAYTDWGRLSSAHRISVEFSW